MSLFEKIPDSVYRFAARFESAGFECYPVGGCVRDLLSGKNPADYDFAVSSPPELTCKLFRRVIPTGIKHGTVTVLFEGFSFEATTFRTENGYSDSRRPDSVSFTGSLAEDLKRRDFTVNALALDLKNQKIIDLFDGCGDLKRKLIRCIGSPQERFEEDALRLLRAVRFASCLGFEIDHPTFEAIVKAAPSVKKISAERIRDELTKIMKSSKPSIGWELMRRSGLITAVLPELVPCIGFQETENRRRDLYTRLIETCDALPPEKPLLRWAALLNNIGKTKSLAEKDNRQSDNDYGKISAEIAGAVMRRLKFSNEQTQTVRLLIKTGTIRYDSSWSDGAIRRFAAAVPENLWDDWFTLRRAEALTEESRTTLLLLDEFRERFRKCAMENPALSLKDLAINGVDLLAAGFPKSRIIGDTLKFLLEVVLENPSENTRERLTELAKEYLLRTSENQS